MKYLITGGSGFIGTRLTQSLLQDKRNSIFILSRNERESKNDQLKFVKWNGKLIPETIDKVDAIVNLAGASLADKRWSQQWKQVVIDSRVQATQACVNYIKNSKDKPKVFISASGVGYYGGNRKAVMDEESDAGTDFLAETCIKWEEASREAGIRTVNIRISVVMDKQGGPLEVIMKPFKFFVGGPIASGKQHFPWIHIDDWIAAFEFCVRNEKVQGPVNFVAPNSVTNEKLAHLLGKILRRPSFFTVPKFVLDLLMGEQSIMAWGSMHAIPKKLLEHGFEFRYPEIQEALSDLIQPKKSTT